MRELCPTSSTTHPSSSSSPNLTIPTVPWTPQDGFPHKLTDPELEKAIADISCDVAATYESEVGKADISLSLLQAALQEQARRGIEETNRISQKATDQARSATRNSFWIAVAALAVAVLSAAAAVVVGVVSIHESRSWQHSQTHLLTQIRQSEVAQAKLLAQLRDKEATTSEAQAKLLKQIRDRLPRR
jgi:hypothetical protein